MLFPKRRTDEWCDSNRGVFLEADDDTVFVKDTTRALTEDGRLLFHFLKNYAAESITDQMFASLRRGCVKCDNRGVAAGPFNTQWYQEKMRTSGRALVETSNVNGKTVEVWRGGDMVDVVLKHWDGAFKVNVNKQTKGNEVSMAMMGWTDTPNRMTKDKSRCRQTAFTANHRTHYENALPLIESMDSAFAKHAPEAHERQAAAIARIDARIGNTAFSTVTVNYNWRTALHKDSGDFADGFGVFSVVENAKNNASFEGNEIFFPQYNVCIDVRQGDVLLFDPHQWHCNNTGRMDQTRQRISLVCYLREKLLQTCPASNSSGCDVPDSAGEPPLKRKKTRAPAEPGVVPTE